MADQPTSSSAQRLAEQYGGLVGADEASVPTAVTFAQVLPADADRIAVIFSNAGANPILLSIRPNNASTTGILLAVSSPPFQVTVEEEGNLPMESWSAASPAGVSALHIVSSKRVR